MPKYLYIGGGPHQEKLAKPTDINYQEVAKRERFSFIGQLKRLAGIPPIGATLQILPVTAMPVVCFYETPAAKQYALKVESLIPHTWDEEAKQDQSDRAKVS